MIYIKMYFLFVPNIRNVVHFSIIDFVSSNLVKFLLILIIGQLILLVFYITIISAMEKNNKYFISSFTILYCLFPFPALLHWLGSPVPWWMEVMMGTFIFFLISTVLYCLSINKDVFWRCFRYLWSEKECFFLFLVC